ncbi:MAG: 30S ribosomal protein S4, partial [bacterium]|nr:30S ribosomal protein S4 [bacterium]
MYGMVEAQFHGFYEKALRQTGITASNLMVMLESRLDNIVYRMGFAPSRASARQLVRHGHFMVNGRRVNIPSYQLGNGDIVRVAEAEHSRKLVIIHDAMKRVNTSRMPTYVSLDKAKMEGTFSRPERSDIPETMKLREQLIVELYSK